MDREPLPSVDRRIAAALQVDGRASWRGIAEAIGEPVRTVSRRGSALLENGSVRVTALASLTESYIAQIYCEAKAVHAVAGAVAARPDSVYVYSLAGHGTVVAELLLGPISTVGVVQNGLAGLEGVRDHELAPVLHYFRTVAEWRPGVLSQDEVDRLHISDTPPEQNRPEELLDDTDAALVEALVRDGRTPYDALGNIGGISEATARRRVEALIRRGVVRIRAVVDPAAFGLPLETILWIDCAPRDAMRVGTQLVASAQVRYAALLLSGTTILADVTTRGVTDLSELLTTGSWTSRVQRIRSSTLLRAYKRSGLLV